MTEPRECAPSRKIRFLERLAEEWNRAGIGWAVCNGLEDYPVGIGRDLDVVTTRSDLRNALEITVRLLRESGFKPLPFKLGWIFWVVGVMEREGKVESLQVDLFDHLQWAFCWPVDGVGRFGDLVEIGPFRVDPAASLGKRLLLNGLSGNFRVFEKKPHYLDLNPEERKVFPGLLQSLSGSEESEVFEAVLQRDLAALTRAFRSYRKRVARASLAPGRKWFRRMASAISKQWSINLFPRRAVPTIAVQAEDRDDEMEVARILNERISDELVFCNVIRERHRPGFLFRNGVDRAWKLFADYRVGERVRDRRRSATQCVQIYMGHALGVHRHPDRVGLDSFPAWMVRRVPRPEINVYVIPKGANASVEEWVGNGHLDEVIECSANAEAASRVYARLIDHLADDLSRRQCRLLNLDSV